METFIQVEEFLDRNREIVERAVTPQARRSFSERQARMVGHVKEQDAYNRIARSSSPTKQALRNRLIRSHMQPLALLATTGIAGVEPTSFAVPSRKRPFVDFVAAGHGMATAAKAHEAAFVDRGLRSGFIERLVAATDELNDAIKEKGQTKALRMKATAGLKAEAHAALVALRLIDFQITAAIEHDASLLAEWVSVSHVTRVPTRSEVGGIEVSALTSAVATEESMVTNSAVTGEAVAETTVEPIAEAVAETVAATLAEVVAETVARTEAESGAETLARILGEVREVVPVEVPRRREAA
jgi:hypothetical protein